MATPRRATRSASRDSNIPAGIFTSTGRRNPGSQPESASGLPAKSSTSYGGQAKQTRAEKASAAEGVTGFAGVFGGLRAEV